jgi:hypothetical protein
MPIEQLKRFLARLGEFALPGAVVDYDNRGFVAWNKAFLDRTGYSADEIRVLEPRTIILLGSDTEGSAPKETDDANHKRFAVANARPSEAWRTGNLRFQFWCDSGVTSPVPTLRRHERFPMTNRFFFTNQ